MRRTQIYITDQQDERLAARSHDAGVPKAQVIRAILDEALGLDDGLEERRRALLATAGLLAGEDDWPAWLARVRGVGAAERLARLAT